MSQENDQGDQMPHSPEASSPLEAVSYGALMRDRLFLKLEVELNTAVPEHEQQNGRTQQDRFRTLHHYQYLEQNGYLETSLDEPRDGSGYIIYEDDFPIINRNNFYSYTEYGTMGDDAYQAMKPAIALVNKLLTSQPLLGWWIHAMYGQSQVENGTQKRYYSLNAMELINMNQARLDLQQHWNSLSKKIRFYWCPRQRANGKILNGVTSLNEEKAMAGLSRGDSTQGLTTLEPNPRIGLSTSLLYQLLSPELRQGREFCEDLRLQFFLAKVIVHELAHAFLLGKGETEEPYVYRNDLRNEAGQSWENWAFGALLSIPHVDTPYGPLYARAWRQGSASSELWIPVPMDWIVKWFRKQTWRKLQIPYLTQRVGPLLLRTLPAPDRSSVRYQGIRNIEQEDLELKMPPMAPELLLENKQPKVF